ncbi:PLP-dependent cysteine synthase family protein [Phyllobacterium chamaecytisi]|uniref:PLP-dependent cysteine synthase family protein n=1 Tax=Phyllobacterium chamaecytisi TaxID=2876082 RepID=UPI001CCE1941|nr:cysteine synthase family protein [Phyllobacterium sp. KW56]MBZ9603131.1 cysteine synthase family protein [Phyllobacterium sp. KW56]
MSGAEPFPSSSASRAMLPHVDRASTQTPRPGLRQDVTPSTTAAEARFFGSGIGATPVLELPADLVGGRGVYAKLEKYNPFSSIKDRIAWYMLAGAETRGQLVPGGTVIEATSGNTGIALAGFARARNYRCIIVLPDSASKERIELLKFFGAELELTPSEAGYTAAIEKAEQLRDVTPGAWFACQHENADNVLAHYETTGPELWRDLAGKIDTLVCGVGTGGTISGIGKFLKEQNPDIKIVAVEPERSAVLSGNPGGIHRIPGLNGGFVARTTDRTLIDEIITVADEDAWAMAKKLASAGIVVGISSGAVAEVCRAIRQRSTSDEGRIVTIFPDSGERYVSLLSA